MKEGSSQFWRTQGESIAFDARTWDFNSRKFYSSAQLLIEHHERNAAAHDFRSIMAMSTAHFLISLAVELVCKALYLQKKWGSPERIYTHNVAALVPDGVLDADQLKALLRAERHVVWAGRYPTPKWTRESMKEEFDVPSSFVEGQEQIDANDLPNATSLGAVRELFALYEHIYGILASTHGA